MAENGGQVPQARAWQDNMANENDVESTNFTIQVKSQVEQLIKSAKRQCDKEKHLLQEKHDKDVADLKSQMIQDLNKAFENDLLNPLKAKLTDNEKEVRSLKAQLLASTAKQVKLEKEKNALQNSVNILKLRVEKLEGDLGKDCYSKPEVPIAEKAAADEQILKNKTSDYDKNKKASPVVAESKGVVAAGNKKSKDLLDTDTVILHLEFSNSHTDTSPVILYDRQNQNSEMKTVGQVRAITQAFNNQFPSNQKSQDVEKHLEVIDRKIQDLQRKFVASTAETHAALLNSETKYNQNSVKIMDEILHVQQKIDTLVNSLDQRRSI